MKMINTKTKALSAYSEAMAAPAAVVGFASAWGRVVRVRAKLLAASIASQRCWKWTWNQAGWWWTTPAAAALATAFSVAR